MSINGVSHEKPDRPQQVGLPMTPFLYHLDQVAIMLNMTEDQLVDTLIFFSGRSFGRLSPRQIKAINISADPEGSPMWRVTEGELVRWLKLLGIRVFSRGRAI